MAVVKISELPNMGTVANNDILPIVDVSETETKKITKENLLTDIPAGELDLTNVTETTQINDADYLLISQGGTTKKIKKENTQFASGDEVVVSTTTPVDPDDELKLWVNPDDVITPGGGGGGSCDCLKPYTLYSNNTGTTGNITLSDAYTNYKYLEIVCYHLTTTEEIHKYYVDDIKNGRLHITLSSCSSTNAIIYDKEYTISGTSLNKSSMNYYVITAGTFGTSDNLYITRVIGYK